MHQVLELVSKHRWTDQGNHLAGLACVSANALSTALMVGMRRALEEVRYAKSCASWWGSLSSMDQAWGPLC